MLSVEVASVAKKGKRHKNRDVGEDRTAGEAGLLAEYDESVFPHPSLTVAVALLTATGDALHVLLLRREGHPEIHKWALPGGFVRLDESLGEAAARVLREKAGLSAVFLEQIYTFGDPGRDPRTRVVTVAYYALVPKERLIAAGVPGGAASQLARLRVPWAGERGGPVAALDDLGAALPLAFDHAEILGTAVKRLRGKLDYAPIGFRLLPEVFSLGALQQIHEVISGRRFNKDSFRRRMLASGRLEATGQHQTDVEYRPPALYRYVDAVHR
jgi:8-oxo-dGTP diphosphatase